MFFDPKRIHQLGGRKQVSGNPQLQQMTDITSIFEKLDLAGYVEVFTENGFDTWEDVLDITESDLETLGVKIGHRRRLQREIASWKGVNIEQVISSSERASSIEGGQAGDAESRAARQDNAQPGGTTKRRYRRHPKADKHAPERPPSAYVLFSNQVREELKPQNLTFTNIAKIVGERWQQLDTNGREPYETQATTMKDEYNAKLAEYKKTDEWRDYQEYLTNFKAAQLQSAGAASESKKPKLERTNESSHGSSRGSVGTPSTSAHGSPISMASSSMHPPMPEAGASSLSSPSSSAAYSHHMVAARNAGTPPSRPPNIGQAFQDFSGPYAPSSQPALPSMAPDVSRSLPRRSNNPPAPFLQHQRDKHDTSTGSMSSHHSSVSQGSSVYTPLTPVETGSSGYIAARPQLGESTPTYTQQSMNRLSIGAQASAAPSANATSSPFGVPPPQPSLPPDVASRILPPPQPITQSPQQRLDGMSILALAGTIMDGEGAKDNKPKPP